MGVRYDQRSTSPAPPDTAVDDSGAEYDTIQNAVDNTGNYVLIGPGTFNEAVTVDSADMYIEGAGQATIIDGGTSGHAIEFTNNAIDPTLANVTVKTTAGQGNDHNGVITKNVSDPLIFNVRVTDADQNGIEIDGAANGTILACVVEGADEDGIDVVQSRGSVVDCTVGEPSNQHIGTHGIRLAGQASSAVGCKVFNTGGKGFLVNGTESSIQSCQVDSSADDGIRATSVRQAIQDCFIKNAGVAGISAGADDQLISGCRVEDSSSEGVKISGTDQKVSDTIITNSTGTGLSTGNATNPKVSNVTVDGTTQTELETLSAAAKQGIQVAPISTTTLSDGEFVSFRLRVPSGKTLNIWSVGVQNISNNAPSGLTAEVDDETNSNNLVSQNAKRATGSPLASVSGAVDVAFRAENDTGGSQDATATFGYTIE